MSCKMLKFIMLKRILGKQTKDLSLKELRKLIGKSEKVYMDIGCGDGKFIYKLARENPRNFYIGIEPAMEQVAEVSLKSTKKSSRGGTSNLIFINSSFEDIPKPLYGIADFIYILFPWGKLLEDVASCSQIFLQNISHLSSAICDLEICFAYDEKFEENYISARNLPKINKDKYSENFTNGLKTFGFETNKFEIKEISSKNGDVMKTSWGKKITSERERTLWKISAEILKPVKGRVEKPNIEIDLDNRKKYSFVAYGHPNILATHVKTLEFTKDEEISERGDCIIGVRANFDKNELKKFGKKVTFIVETSDPESGEKLRSEFKTKVNHKFESDHELVLRKSFFQSDRTYGFGLNRGANHLDRRIAELLRNGDTMINITIVEGWY